MTTVDGPRLLDRGEFDEMMALLDRCFSFERGGMASRLPFVYDQDRPERHAVITVDGEIVSHVAAIPEALVAGADTRIPCRGIGGVATAKPHRGNGYMSQLLEFWLERMDEEGTLLSELGGDRTRYGRFGYERAGPEVVYRLTERSIQVEPDQAAVRSFRGDPGDIRALQRLHRQDVPRIHRDDPTARAVYGQRGMETLLYEPEGEVETYLCLSRERRRRAVAEFGGDPAGLDPLLAHCLGSWAVDRIAVYAPLSHPFHEALVRHASMWRTRPARLLHVRDLPGLLSAYEGALEREWTARPRAIEDRTTVAIDDQPTSAAIVATPKSLSIETVDEPAEVELDRRAAARLLYGGPERMQAVKAARPLLDALFPLPFHVWNSERV